MERTDDTGFGGIRVIQNKGSGYGVDAVLLAAFAAGETGARGLPKDTARPLKIADLGTGCGIAAFILHHKLGGARLTGYDISAGAIDRARRACIMNGLDGDISFICSDIKDIQADGDLDAVISNPPYFRRTPLEPGAADPDERYVARHEITADVSDFAAVSAAMLREGGHLYMVHRPGRLADIITAMRAAGVEAKEMQLVIPKPGKAANIVLLHGIKGAGSELRMLPHITVHAGDGAYTEEILKYYGRV